MASKQSLGGTNSWINTLCNDVETFNHYNNSLKTIFFKLFFWGGGEAHGRQGTIYYHPSDGDQKYAMRVVIASTDLEWTSCINQTLKS